MSDKIVESIARARSYHSGYREPEKKFVIAVDLDGTLAKYNEWNGINVIGEPNKECVKLLNQLEKEGWYIIINTCRLNGSWENIDYDSAFNTLSKWLRNHSIPYDKIATKLDGKVVADIYLDDRAVNFSKNVDHDFYSQVLYYAIMNVIGDKNE